MADNLPARIPTTSLMPPEDHLRPRKPSVFRALGFSVTAGFTFVVLTLFGASTTLPLLVAGLLFVGWAILFARRANHTNERNQRGVHLLNAGDIQQAEQIFDQLAAKNKRSWNHVIFVYNVGVSALLQGRYQRALSIFNAIDHSQLMRQHRRFRNLEPNLYIEMGCCLALGGRVSEARAQLARAEALLEPPEDARLLFLEALVRIRSGHFEDAVDRMDEKWRRAEGMLRGPTLRTMRMLYGFALSRLGRETDRKFQMMVAGAMPATPEDFAWATTSWPEFARFVETHAAW